jgi:hypothetical protein
VNNLLDASSSESNDEYLAQATPSSSGPNALTVVLLAFAVVAASIGAYVYFGQKPPVATGEIIRLTAVPIHSETQGPAEPGLQGQAEVFDEVLLLARVKLHNQSKLPLFLHDMYASLSLPDELERRSLAVNKTDFNRAFVAYPQLQPLKGEPLVRDITIEPGQTVEGMMLFPYPITGDEYNKKTSLDLNVIFLHQKTLTMPAPK